MFMQIFLLVLSYAVSYATQPKPKHAKPAALTDFEFPQIDESSAQSVVFGDCVSRGWFVLGIGNFRTTAIKK
ncbi:MAG TPA: hypothetical protein VL995_11445 [Cellvibrio sp.]|nr:hypothetical protein [Cellvibrio sp.]